MSESLTDLGFRWSHFSECWTVMSTSHWNGQENVGIGNQQRPPNFWFSMRWLHTTSMVVHFEWRIKRESHSRNLGLWLPIILESVSIIQISVRMWSAACTGQRFGIEEDWRIDFPNGRCHPQSPYPTATFAQARVLCYRPDFPLRLRRHVGSCCSYGQGLRGCREACHLREGMPVGERHFYAAGSHRRGHVGWPSSAPPWDGRLSFAACQHRWTNFGRRQLWRIVWHPCRSLPKYPWRLINF